MDVLEHIKMTSTCCTGTSPLIPGAAILMRVLEHIKMTLLSCPRTSPLIPGAALAPEPPQCLQVTTPGCTRACHLTPRAALAPEPLQYLQMAVLTGNDKVPLIPAEPILGFQPPQGLHLASAHCEEENARLSQKPKRRRRRR